MDGPPDMFVQASVIDDEADIPVLLGDKESRCTPFGWIVLTCDHFAINEFLDDLLCFLPLMQWNLPSCGDAERCLFPGCQMDLHRDTSCVH